MKPEQSKLRIAKILKSKGATQTTLFPSGKTNKYKAPVVIKKDKQN